MPRCHRVGGSLTSSAFALVSRSHSPVNSRLASTKSQIITRLGSSETLTNSQNHKVKFQTPRFPEILNSIRKRSNVVENDEKDLDETCRNRGHEAMHKLSTESSRSWTNEVHPAHNPESKHLLKSCSLSSQLASGPSPTVW